MALHSGRAPTPRIAIIGAGISGLTSARTLHDSGFEVTVFEKSRGTGGRAATRRLDAGLSFDHGAQYFTARDPRFVRQVEAWTAQNFVAEWTGQIVSIDGEVARLKEDQPRRYVGVPGMTAVAHHLAAGVRINRETRIVGLDRVGEKWHLVDALGQSYQAFDHLIVSLPSQQTADLLGDHALSAKARAVPMTPCWAVLAAFEERVGVTWDGAFVSGSPLSWVARNSSKPGRDSSQDCWVLHASPDWSAANLELAREDVKAILLNSFAKLTAPNAPAPVYLEAHRWMFSATPLSLDELVLLDSDSGLVVCGDWLAGGRVEGAYRSGVVAAESILRQRGIAGEERPSEPS